MTIVLGTYCILVIIVSRQEDMEMDRIKKRCL